MQTPLRHHCTGHGDIHPGHGGSIKRLLQLSAASLQSGGNGGTSLIEQRTHGGFLFPGHITHALLNLGQRTLLAEDSHAGVLQFLHAGNPRNQGKSIGLYASNLSFHNLRPATIRARGRMSSKMNNARGQLVLFCEC